MYLLGLDRNDLAAPLDLLHGIGLALSCLLQHGLRHQVMIKAFVTGWIYMPENSRTHALLRTSSLALRKSNVAPPSCLRSATSFWMSSCD